MFLRVEKEFRNKLIIMYTLGMNEEQFNIKKPNSELSQRVKNELGLENLNNVRTLAQAIQTVSFEAGYKSHLLLVGGMVKPEKQGRYHKDIDMVFYCPPLGTEYYNGDGDHKKFDNLAVFLGKVNDKLGWKMDVVNPWFMDYEFAGDGKIVLSANNGVPIEVLPVREECLGNSFEDFLKSEREPYEVVF